ncbi:MAG TPA: 23S rRNA (uracil(1939)-C(5))-methyltransferase RlmD [Candidatus Acidoferrales bacterium]|jgi:23S rRNA (uracil1939-C5)-methyltransferase|nr:23S rRNA (uracil(1939)-C(5))-methyltransferase RlmD [Candidatus Acidoferrales bacterium]
MDLTIEKLIYGGEGLGHYNGSTVFVPFVLPAERVSAEPVEQKKKFVRARMERVLEPSPERIAPRCPHFGVCGGCDYQHAPYESQLRYKSAILRETLGRIGRVDWPGEITEHASPPWGYRNRAQWKIRSIENGSGGEKSAIGYFRAGSTALCDVEDCQILSPLLLKTLLALRGALAAGTLPRELREIEAFAGANDSKLLLTVTFAKFPKKADDVAKTFHEIAPEIESLLFHDPGRDRMELDGTGFVDYPSGATTFRVGHFSFFQVNRFLSDALAREVADNEAGKLALDLFSGVGLFSIPLAKTFEHVLAVESNPAASRDLESNARTSSGIEIRTADVEQFLARYKAKPDLIVLDPPRAGLAPGDAKHLLRIAPERITYVSCDPPTLARDLAALMRGGYEIAAIHLFDLFPQTFHMETVVRLRRRS